MKTLIAFACLLLLATVADARPRQRAAYAFASATATDASVTENYATAGFLLVTTARFYVGGNPTDMNRVWCGRFMRLVLRRALGRDPGPDYDAAWSYRRLGRPGFAQPGAIVYWSHHVGIVVRVTRPGHAIVISGNDGRAGSRQVMERERPIAGAGFRHL